MKFAPGKGYEKVFKVSIPLEVLKPFTVSLPLTVYSNARATNGQALGRRLQLTNSLPTGWMVTSNSACTALYKVKCINQPLNVVTNSLVIHDGRPYVDTFHRLYYSLAYAHSGSSHHTPLSPERLRSNCSS